MESLAPLFRLCALSDNGASGRGAEPNEALLLDKQRVWYVGTQLWAPDIGAISPHGRQVEP